MRAPGTAPPQPASPPGAGNLKRPPPGPLPDPRNDLGSRWLPRGGLELQVSWTPFSGAVAALDFLAKAQK